MRVFLVVAAGLAALLGASCSGLGDKDEPSSLAAGLSVMETDVRMGLTADDGLEGEAVLEGDGFEKIGPHSYIALIADAEGRGELRDGNNAVASALALNSMNLQASVLVRPGAVGAKSSAQAVQLATTALSSTETVEEVRVEIETVLEAVLSGGAVAICEVEGEARLDGHSVAKISTKLHLYPEDGKVAVYVGPRSSGRPPLGVMASGERFTAKDPSFFFKLGPGLYRLLYTLKVSAACPGDETGGTASVKAAGEVALR